MKINSALILSIASLVGAKKVTNNYCKRCDVVANQNNKYWGFENDQWCEISPKCISKEKECASYPLYPCCKECNLVGETDEGEWGIENGQWCGLKYSCNDSNVIDNNYEEGSEFSESSEEEDIRIVENGIIYPDDPYIYYVGRWDSENISQWSAAGIKFDFTGTSFTLVAGERTQTSVLSIAYSIDYQILKYQNITIGENVIASGLEDTDHNIQFYITSNDGNFLQLDSLVIDEGAKIHKYEPLDKYIQIVGDSLSAGQWAPHEATDAWSFLFGQYMNVENDIIAKGGICLTDIPLYGMEHGMEISYFMTSNPVAGPYGYHNDEAYDFTQRREPDLMIIFLGTNDAGDDAKVPVDEYFETLKKFIAKIRGIYPNTPIAINSLLYNPGDWNDVQSEIVNYFDNIYYIPINNINVDGVSIRKPPYAYSTNSHPTEMGHCLLMNTMVEKISEIVGFEKQERPTNKWGMHDNIATGYDICDTPYDDSVVYHYIWENYGGVGLW